MRKKIRKSQPGYTNIVGYRIIRMKKCQFPCSPHIFRLHYSQKLTFANSLMCVSYPRFSAFTTNFYKFFSPSARFFPHFTAKPDLFHGTLYACRTDRSVFCRVCGIQRSRTFAVRRLHTYRPKRTSSLRLLSLTSDRITGALVSFLLISRISG